MKNLGPIQFRLRGIKCMIKTMIVDNDSLIREIVQKVLEDNNQIELMYKAEDGLECLKLLEKNPVDLVLLDIGMPKMNGIEALQNIKQFHPKVKVIMLTSCKDKEIVLKCLNLGAEGYLSKDIDIKGITDAIIRVMNGEVITFPKVSDLIKEDMDYVKKQIELNSKSQRLTRRELQVMSLISKGMSNKSIASSLEISDKTVKNHVSSILKKIDVNDRTQIAVYVLNNKAV